MWCFVHTWRAFKTMLSRTRVYPTVFTLDKEEGAFFKCFYCLLAHVHNLQLEEAKCKLSKWWKSCNLGKKRKRFGSLLLCLQWQIWATIIRRVALVCLYLKRKQMQTYLGSSLFSGFTRQTILTLVSFTVCSMRHYQIQVLDLFKFDLGWLTMRIQ